MPAIGSQIWIMITIAITITIATTITITLTITLMIAIMITITINNPMFYQLLQKQIAFWAYLNALLANALKL